MKGFFVGVWVEVTDKADLHAAARASYVGRNLRCETVFEDVVQLLGISSNPDVINCLAELYANDKVGLQVTGHEIKETA